MHTIAAGQGGGGAEAELSGHWAAQPRYILGQGGGAVCPLPGDVSGQCPCHGGWLPQDQVTHDITEQDSVNICLFSGTQ